MDSRQRQDLDNWITGHYGIDDDPYDPEYDFRDDGEEMDDKQEITFTIATKMSREDAETLASFLHEMLFDMMKIEAVVSFVTEDEENE